MHKKIYFTFLISFFCFAQASKPLTHLERISKHLFLIKPDPAYVAVEPELEIDGGNESDSSDEGASIPDPADTKLRKEIEDFCSATAQIKTHEMKELAHVLNLAGKLKEAHTKFLSLVSNPERARSKRCISVMNGFPLNSKCPHFDKKSYSALCDNLDKKFPTKFGKVKIIVNTCGLKNAREALEKQLIHIEKNSPMAAKVINGVFKQHKIYTIGALVEHVVPQ